jgi:hypothetical protein
MLLYGRRLFTERLEQRSDFVNDLIRSWMRRELMCKYFTRILTIVGWCISSATRMKRLTAQLAEQFAESSRLEHQIRNNLKGLGYEW